METRVILSCTIVLMIGLVSAQKIDSPLPCRNTSDCTNVPTLPADTFCKDGFCMCPNVDKEVKNCSRFTASIHERKIPGSLVFRTCKHDQDCSFQGGFCNNTNHQCECSKGYVPSSNKQRCVEMAQSINSPCTDENQCLAFLANTTCHANKCICASGYHYVDNACWRMAGYGQPCTKNQECLHIEGVICMGNMTCGCAVETMLNADGKRCLAVARKIRDECTESVQCAAFEHTSCIDKMCQCRENYHYERDTTKCYPDKEIDAVCANNYECYQAEDYESDSSIRSLICDASRCICAENYVRRENRCVSAGSSSVASLLVIVSLVALINGLSLW